MVPCAEAVRFGKNGSDATAGAVRLARAFTGRDHVAVCGYHGWQDWYIGTTARNLGVPAATTALTHTFSYNDLPSLEKVLDAHEGSVAAIVLEPMNVVSPAPGFLEGVREIATKRGIVLIFDETITGFRFARGGAQEFFGVTPDLATFGKGLANGYPLSAVAGRSHIMKKMEDIFFSFTFGGETLSLAAAKATLRKLREQPVLETIRSNGERLLADLNALIERHHAGHLLHTSGHPSWTFLNITPAPPYDAFNIKTFLLQELFARGVLSLGSHNLSFAHGTPELDTLLAAYDEIVPRLVELVTAGTLLEGLDCESLQPLFKVR
jgi:glutamate-1-semialdehyde 2,1-aminomutase